MVLETADLPVTELYADKLPVSRNNDDCLHDNNWLHVAHSDVERIIDSAMLRYEENSMIPLSHEIIRNTKETLLKTTAKKATKGNDSPIYRAVEDIVKRAITSCETAIAIISELDKPTEPKEFAQYIVGCITKTITPTAPITGLVKNMLK